MRLRTLAERVGLDDRLTDDLRIVALVPQFRERGKTAGLLIVRIETQIPAVANDDQVVVPGSLRWLDADWFIVLSR